MPRRLSGFLSISAVIAALTLPSGAKAFNWKQYTLGVSGGFGGSGIEKSVTIDSEETEIKRSEGPGMFGLSVNWLLTDRWGVGLEHRRGFRFSPFTLGVGFTGASVSWYFLRSPPVVINKSVKSYASFGRWSPFVGASTGVASGAISRENQIVEEISSSGIYFGVRAGVDYQLYPTLILRPELTTSTTLFSSATEPASLSEFGLMIGILFKL